MKRTLAILITAVMIPLIGSAANTFTETVDQDITNGGNWSQGAPAFGSTITDHRWNINGTTEYTAAQGDTTINIGRGLLAASGNNQTGNLTISGGSIHIVNTAADEAIISAPSQTGTSTGIVTCAGGDLIVDNWLSVASRGGANAYGELTINSGSTVTADEIVFVGLNAGSPVGVVNINAGGTLKTRQIWNRRDEATVSVNFDGGILEAVNDGGNLDDDLIGSLVDAVEIKAGGATIDTAADEQQISTALSGVGNISIINGGAVRFNGTNTYTGTLSFADGVGIGGSGVIPHALTLGANSALLPGDANATGGGGLTVSGDLDISAPLTGSGKMKFQGGLGGFDGVTVSGTLTIGSGQFGIADIDFNDDGLPSGTYVVASAGSLSGTLDGADLTGAVGNRGGTGTLSIVGNEILLSFTEGYPNELTFENMVDQDISNPGNWSYPPVFNEIRGQLWNIDGTTTYGASQGDTTLAFEQALVVGSMGNSSGGDFTISGGSLTLDCDQDAVIADISAGDRTASMTVSGGTFTVAGNGNLRLGNDLNDNTFDAMLNVSGGDVVISNNLKVARTGNTSFDSQNSIASINVSSGSLYIHNTLYNGDNQADVHTFNLNISGGSMTIGNDLTIRRGTINLTGGDLTVVDNIDHWGSFAPQLESLVTVNIQSGSTLSCDVLRGRNMTVNLESGGTLRSRYLLGTDNDTTYTFNMNGGTLIGSTNDAAHTLISGFVDSVVLTGANTIDCSGRDQRLYAYMSGDGSLTVTGGGIYRINTNATYAGATTITDGVILSGRGSIAGDVVLASADCGFAPGNAGIGTLTFGSNLDISLVSTTTNTAINYGLTNTNDSDLAVIGGTLDIGTGTLGISDFEFFDNSNGGLSNGLVVTLFEAGSISGTLDASDLSGAVGNDGALGELSMTGTTIVLTITRGADPSKVADWLQSYGLDFYTENEDPDGDGVDNLSEYAFDGDPTNSLDRGVVPFAGELEQGGTNYFISVHQERTGDDRGIDYNILTIDDLVFGTPSTNYHTLLGISATNDYRATYTNGVPLDAAPMYFINVEIEKR